MLRLARTIRALRRKETLPVVTVQCLRVMMKIRPVCGPYEENDPPFRTYAQDFLELYRSGDVRTREGLPEISPDELEILCHAAGNEVHA